MTIERRKKQKAEYENVRIQPKTVEKSQISLDSRASSVVIQKNEQEFAYDKEIQAFVDMVTIVRSAFKSDDDKTNVGLVISPKITSAYPEKTSIKIVVHFDKCITKENVVTFTCDVNSSIEHIICTVIADVKDQDVQADKYILQVSGVNEYLENHSFLQEYEYVHQCYKFDRDVEFILLSTDDVVRSLARTPEDDIKDSKVFF